MQRRHLALTLLVLAVATAGCTSLLGGDSDDDGPDLRVTASDGLSTTFRSLSQTYREGEDIGLRLEVANTGEAPARDLSARIYGPLFFTSSSCGNLVRGLGSSLRGVDRAAGQAGQTTAVEWTCTNPVDLASGETRDVTAGAAVAYRYNTTASAQFRVVPRETFTGTSSPVSTDTSAAPVSASIDISSPVTIAPPEQQPTQVATFNISTMRYDPATRELTLVFNHEVDTGDFDLSADLSAFTFRDGDGSVPASVSVPDDVSGNQVTFTMSRGVSGTLQVDSSVHRVDIENTANDQVLTDVDCGIDVGSEQTEGACDNQDWETGSFYWQDIKIETSGNGATAYLRLSEDVGDFRVPETDIGDAVRITNESTNQETPHVNFTGSITADGNIVMLSLETSDRDITGDTLQITWLSRSNFGFVSGESDRVMDLGSCSAAVGEGYYGFGDGGERHCASSTEQVEQDEGGGIAVPVTVRNVGDGMVGNLDQQPQAVRMSAQIPNAPDGVSVRSCLGSTSFPVAFQMFGDRRDITCSVVLPEEAYDTQFTMELRLEYTYAETVETGFSLEGLS